MIVMALQFFGLFHGFAPAPRSASAAARSPRSLRGLLAAPQPGGAARARRVQRLPALPAGLCLRRPGGEHGGAAARASRHAGLRPRHLPGDAGDGRRRPRRSRRPGGGAASGSPGACILLLGLDHDRARRRCPRASCARQAGHPPTHAQPDDRGGRRTLQPLPPAARPAPDAAHARTARPRAFCCYGCCIAFQVRTRRGARSRRRPGC